MCEEAHSATKAPWQIDIVMINLFINRLINVQDFIIYVIQPLKKR